MSDENVQQSTHNEDKDTLKRPKTNMVKRVGYGLIVLALVGMVVQQLWTLRVWDVLQQEEVTVTNVDKQLVANEGSLQRQKNEIDELREMLLHDRLLLQLDRLEDQMDAGWQLWLITGDSQRLVQSMEQGQRWLLQVPGAEAHALRMALTRDLVDIRSRQSMDLRDTTQQLDGVIASIDKLPLKQEHRVKNDVKSELPPVVSSTSEMTTLMERSRAIATELAAEVWQAIRSMIRVQRLDQTEQALLAPEQKIFLQQGLRMLLLDARHALVQRNTPLYQQSLNQAGLWLSKYFDEADPLVQKDLELLKTLVGINVDPAAIRFDQTRQALELLRSALSENMLFSQLHADPAEHSLVPGKQTPLESVKGDAT